MHGIEVSRLEKLWDDCVAKLEKQTVVIRFDRASDKPSTLNSSLEQRTHHTTDWGSDRPFRILGLQTSQVTESVLWPFPCLTLPSPSLAQPSLPSPDGSVQAHQPQPRGNSTDK